ncbi:C-type lectin domain family 2 member B-like [Tiliqua scincoides]|uniref:C-type lectin domain family 2 member B-like n=1 Tax=Tiliqua scincoides TaxID=71010 RepID=UPI0034624B87
MQSQVKARPFPVAPSSSGNISCPQDWIGKGGRCYFFSPTEGSWIFSQSNCSSSGGSLVTVDTQAEMTHYPHGVLEMSQFRIEGDGHCAYLNEDIVSSTWCDNRRRWICSRSLHAS